jgi:hypothetical protein
LLRRSEGAQKMPPSRPYSGELGVMSMMRIVIAERSLLLNACEKRKMITGLVAKPETVAAASMKRRAAGGSRSSGGRGCPLKSMPPPSFLRMSLGKGRR